MGIIKEIKSINKEDADECFSSIKQYWKKLNFIEKLFLTVLLLLISPFIIWLLYNILYVAFLTVISIIWFIIVGIAFVLEMFVQDMISLIGVF